MQINLHRWHARLGICTALFVLVFSLTGLLLNHRESLRLDEHHVQAGWLLELYRITPDTEPVSYRIGEDWTTQLGQRLYFNDRELLSDVTRLHGAARVREQSVLAVDNRLVLLERDGVIIEVLGGAEGVPSGMQKIGTDANHQLVINAAHGYYQVDLEELVWREAVHIVAQWAEPQPLPNPLHQAILHDWRGKGLSLERILLDLHSGRLWGGPGVWLYDAAAILFILLALSGSWMWYRRW